MIDLFLNYKHNDGKLIKDFEIIIDKIPAFIYVKDKENNYIRVNQRVADIYRKSKEQLKGKNLSELHRKDQAKVSWEDDLEVIRTKKPKINIEEILETKEGKWWVNTKKIPLIDDKGEVNGILGFSIDITKRKEFELELRKNEERLKSLLEFSQVRGIPETEFIKVALEECVRLTGSNVGYFHFIDEDQNTIDLYTWSKEVMKNCYSEEATHYPLDQAGIWADCARKRKPVIHNDYRRIKNKKGLPEGHFPVKRHMSIPIFDGEKIVAIVGVGNKEDRYDKSDVQQLNLFMNNMWNIIKQHRSEEELIRMASIVENSNDGIISIDLNGKIENWNKGAEKIYGYNEKEIRNHDLSIIFPTKLESKVSNFIKRIRKGEAIKQFETVNLNSKKESIYVSISVSPIRNLIGDVIGISLITRDITEHKRMEEKYRDLYDEAPNAYFSISKDKSILKCNKNAEKLLGYTQEELLDMKVFDLYANTPDGLTKAKKLFKKFLQGGRIQDEELQMKKKSGEHFWISLSVKQILNKKGNVIESRSIVLDITKRKIAEQKLKEYKEELEIKIEERTRDLGERVKELDCLYAISQLTEKSNITSGELILETLDLIPSAFQFPEITSVRITYENNKYKKINFKETKWKLFTKVMVHKKPLEIEVHYLEDKPFLKEERELIIDIGNRLKNLFEKKLVQDELRASEKEITAVYENAPVLMILVDGERRVRKANKLAIGFANRPEEDMLGLRGGEALRCMNALNDPRGCGFSSECQICNVRNTVFDTFNTRESHYGVEATLPFLRDKKKTELNLLVSSVPLETQGENLVLVSINDVTVLKKAEEKLRTNEEFLTNIFTSIQDGISVLDKELNILQVNLTMEDWYSHALPLNGKKCYEAYHGRNKPCKICPSLQSLKTGSVAYEIVPFTGSNGRIIGWMDLYSFPLIDPITKEIKGVIEYVRDITERRKVEQKLKESEEKYRNLFESNLDGIVMTDLEGRFIDCNQAYLDMLGYTFEELKNLTFRDTTPEKWYENDAKAIKEIIKKGHVEGFEKELIRKAGTIFLVNIKAFLIKSTNGEPTGMWAIIRDITEPKRVYEALRESEERFRMLTEQSLMGIAIIQDDKYVYVNQAFSDIVEYPVKDMFDWTLEEINNTIHPNDLEFVKQQTIKIQQGRDKEIVLHYAFRKITKSQKTKWVDYYSKKIIYRNKSSVLITEIDITERKQIEENLKKLMADLKRSNEELEQFAYVASHDLQEPLRMIASFTQLLEQRYRDKIDKDANDFINFIVEGAIRLQVLINDLLTFSRVGTRGKPFKATDTNKIISDVKDNLKKLIEESNTLITNDPLPVIAADKAQLTQLFQNLISNAIKFHRKGIAPKVHISGEVKKNKWIFSIRDNGIGIEQENFNRIFVIFQRLHKRNEYSGTGIGLAICKKIIQRHGGKIWVDSNLNKGSTFYFSIPKREVVENEF